MRARERERKLIQYIQRDNDGEGERRRKKKKHLFVECDLSFSLLFLDLDIWNQKKREIKKKKIHMKSIIENISEMKTDSCDKRLNLTLEKLSPVFEPRESCIDGMGIA